MGFHPHRPEGLGPRILSVRACAGVLLTPERERVVRLLIEQVAYDGATNQMKITFSPTVATLFTADHAAAETTS